MKPEHAGFRKALETLFPLYRAEMAEAGEVEQITEESYIEYCYTDDRYMTLHFEHTFKLLEWLQVMRTESTPVLITSSVNSVVNSLKMDDTHSRTSKKASKGKEECLQLSVDVEVLPHVGVTIGDISSHKMCGSCRKHFHSNNCPFCNEAIHPPITNPNVQEGYDSFIGTLIDKFTTADKHVNDHNHFAEIYELWQIFEVQHDPNTILRLAERILSNAQFYVRVNQAVQMKANWLRDAAGIFFRFYGMVQSGEIEVHVDMKHTLDQVIEVIIGPFERLPPPELNGHFHGALYQQALSAWIGARNCQSSSIDIMNQLVRRVGKAIVHCFDHSSNIITKRNLKNMVKERIHLEIALLAKQKVWEAVHETDAVWNTYLK